MKTDKQGRSNQKGTKRAVETFEDSGGGHQGEKQQAQFKRSTVNPETKAPQTKSRGPFAVQFPREHDHALLHAHQLRDRESIVAQL